jgi:hypothetical protein|tara:strand:- start:17046 stop:17201 length:156 start_codon:yes stop_codon:yes gene_type:complete
MKTTKFQDIVSKVTFHEDTPEDMATNIISWVKQTKPIIVQKKGQFYTKGGE